MAIITTLLVYWLLLVLISKVYSLLQLKFLQKFPEKLPKLFKYLLPAMLILTFFLLNQVFENSQKKNTQIFGETKTLKQKGIPILWSEDHEIFIFKDRSIFKYDFKDNEVGDLVFKIEDKSSSLVWETSCFNQDRLFLSMKREDHKNSGIFSSDSKIVDLKQNYKVKILDSKYFIYPDFNCDQSEKKVYLRDGLQTNDESILRLNSLSLETKYYSSTHEMQKVANLVKNLSFGKQKFGTLSSNYDKSRSIYFWYLSDVDFDKSRSSYNWPSKGWWVDIEKKGISEIEIPAGPWVTDYSLYDDLPYLLYGGKSSSYMKIYVSNGEIYAHIYGKAVKNGAEGIYHLIFGENGKPNQWQKIASGTLDYKPLLSKDGCKVVYSVDEEIKITSTCKGPN